MRYTEMRSIAKTGDLLLVEGKSWFSRLIRAVTGQQFSHVAMLIWLGEKERGLYVAEMKEGDGFKITPASQWTQSSGHLYFGMSPEYFNNRQDDIAEAILSLRGQPYGYASLFSVWLSQFTEKNNDNRRYVCSTAVQFAWEAAGYTFHQTPDPGDYARLCDYISKLRD